MEPLEETPELVQRIERISAAALAEQLSSSAPPLVIDVRNPSEWGERRIDVAENIPLSRLSGRLDELDPSRPMVTYCASGYRSVIAASLIQRAGVEQISNLVGGMGAWQAAELPTVPAAV